MNFEIVGVHSANKGAMLMLEAIRERLRRDFPKARFAVPPTWPVEARLANGLWLTPAGLGKTLSWTSFLERTPQKKLRNLVGFIPEREIDVLIDASGFGYGDYWGLSKLSERLTDRLARWKKAGQKAILLPQALGPFETAGMADAFRGALDRLDLAFVRDNASAGFVDAVAPGRPNVHRAPDFTNLLHPELPSRLEDLRGLSVIIPNARVVGGASDTAQETYLAFLKQATDTIRASGREAYILVHEGKHDQALADALNALLDRPLRVVDEPSPLVTKAAIAVAELTVSSRFHGLVSALSSAVPSLACGWSHKYHELMSDYGCPEMIVDVQKREGWAPALELLLASVADPAFRTSLSARGEEERAKSEAMWVRVIEVIR